MKAGQRRNGPPRGENAAADGTSASLRDDQSQQQPEVPFLSVWRNWCVIVISLVLLGTAVFYPLGPTESQPLPVTVDLIASQVEAIRSERELAKVGPHVALSGGIGPRRSRGGAIELMENGDSRWWNQTAAHEAGSGPNQELWSPAGFRIPPTSPDSCPLGLHFGREMSYSNVDLPENRHLADIAPSTEGNRPVIPALIGVEASRKPTLFQIPKVIVQVQTRDQVPLGMRSAMQSIIDSNPQFEHRYFSDRTAEEWMKVHAAPKHLAAFKELLPLRMRAQLFVLCYLFHHGGVYIDAGFLAVENASFTMHPSGLRPTDKFVGLLDRRHRKLSFDLIAATRANPIIGQALATASENVRTHNLGKSVDDMTGGERLTEAALSVRQVSYHKGILGLKQDADIRFMELQGDPSCFLRPITSSESSPASEGTDSSQAQGKPFFWTHYPTYGRETRWYREHTDDAEAMWLKRHLFRTQKCPFGLTLGQEGDSKNVVPQRHRVLVDMAAHHPARIPSGNPQAIPRIIMQTNKADRVPKDLRKAMQTLIDMNPEYEHYYFSDRRIRDFIKQHFDQKTLDAFDAVVPGAYKSDLFRYCFLYVKGGVFLDGDVQAARPIEELIRPDDRFLSAEDCGIGWVHNAFMAAIPGHPIVKKAIEMAVSKISRRIYGDNPLSITGPILLKEAFSAVMQTSQIRVGEYKHNVRLLRYTRQGHCMVGQIEEHGRVVLWMRYLTYKAENRWYMAGKSYYHDMWHEHRVFITPGEVVRKNADHTAPPGRNNQVLSPAQIQAMGQGRKQKVMRRY
jgi:mannosyltransferase OCH1-like enzyme